MRLIISDIWAGAVALGSVGGYAVISDEFMMAVTAGHCFTSQFEHEFKD